MYMYLYTKAHIKKLEDMHIFTGNNLSYKFVINKN